MQMNEFSGLMAERMSSLLLKVTHNLKLEESFAP
jgi:hypothetical protein